MSDPNLPDELNLPDEPNLPDDAPLPVDAGVPDEADQHDIALVAALVELERHVGADGWDRPTRVFALVHTEDLLAAEPGLGDRLNPQGAPIRPATLTAIEQEDFFDERSEDDLIAALDGIVWPDSVFGCAMSTERTFLPADAEAELPSDPAEAAQFVAEHADRQDVRVVVGVDRAGNRHGVGRLASRPDDLMGGADLVPGLSAALAHTLT